MAEQRQNNVALTDEEKEQRAKKRNCTIVTVVSVAAAVLIVVIVLLLLLVKCEPEENVDPPVEHTHTYSSWVVVDEPTCTEEGLRERTCSCGEKETEAIAALGHTAGEAVRENEVAATCTAKGSYEEVIFCTVCEEEVSRKTVEVAALGHDYKGVVTDEVLCLVPGEMTYTCTRCDDSYTEEIAPLRHSWGETKPGLAPTCTAAGYTSYETCTRCGYSNRDIIPAAGHQGGKATCKEKAVCEVCGTSYGELGDHTPGTDYIANEKGHWFACSVCGEELKGTTYAAHDYTGGEQNCKTCGVTDSQYFNFTQLDDGTYSTTLNYNDLPTGDIVIPSYHEGKQITTLPNAAFSKYAALYVYNVDWSITSIKISEGITTIADMAFLYTTNIKVYIPESVVLIDYQAFGGVTGEIIFESLENWLVQECELEATSSGNIITPAGNLIPLDDLTPENALTYLGSTYTSYRWTKQTND